MCSLNPPFDRSQPIVSNRLCSFNSVFFLKKTATSPNLIKLMHHRVIAFILKLIEGEGCGCGAAGGRVRGAGERRPRWGWDEHWACAADEVGDLHIMTYFVSSLGVRMRRFFLYRCPLSADTVVRRCSNAVRTREDDSSFACRRLLDRRCRL